MPSTRRRLGVICGSSGTVRRQLLDRTIIWNQHQVEQLVVDYIDHYNTHRPHRSLDQRAPHGTEPPLADPSTFASCSRPAATVSSTSTNMQPDQPQRIITYPQAVTLHLVVVTPLHAYVAAWRDHDTRAISSAVTASCRITECYGPTYLGRDRVEQWAVAWFGAGGIVHGWQITDHFRTGDRETGEWLFDFTWNGQRSNIRGCSIVHLADGGVDVLREYRATGETYEWRGVCHE